jgi:hypothetical protein
MPRAEPIRPRAARTLAELADEVLHDAAQVAVGSIGHRELALIARALARNRREGVELDRAVQLFGDRAQALDRLEQMLGHGRCVPWESTMTRASSP